MDARSAGPARRPGGDLRQRAIGDPDDLEPRGGARNEVQRRPRHAEAPWRAGRSAPRSLRLRPAAPRPHGQRGAVVADVDWPEDARARGAGRDPQEPDARRRDRQKRRVAAQLMVMTPSTARHSAGPIRWLWATRTEFQRRLDLPAPMVEEIAKDRELRGDVVMLPDEELQQGGMVGHVIADLDGAEAEASWSCRRKSPRSPLHRPVTHCGLSFRRWAPSIGNAISFYASWLTRGKWQRTRSLAVRLPK